MDLKLIFLLIVLTIFSACAPGESVTLENVQDSNVKITNDAAQVNGNEIDISDNVPENTQEKVMVDNENISVKGQIEDGVVKVEVDNKQGASVDVGDAPANIQDWCIAGDSYDFESEQGIVTSDIIGPTSFKGQEYCEAISTTSTEYMDITSTYYFTYGGKEMWVVTDVAGQKTEIFIEN